MQTNELSSVPLIVSIVYLTLFLYKGIVKSKRFTRFIPIIGTTLGAILAVIAFYTSPNVVPSTNILSAILIGATSGLSATGINQIYKQLRKPSLETTKDKDSEETKDEAKDTKEN